MKRPADRDVGLGKPGVIAASLRNDILAGVLQHGERLPSENDLVVRYGVSRNTIRKALEVLASQDMVKTRVGIGTFVSWIDDAVARAPGLTRVSTSHLAGIEVVTARLEIVQDGVLAQSLGLDRTTFIAVDRVHRIAGGGRVIAIERARLPQAPELQSILLSDLRDAALHDVLRSVGIGPSRGEEWVDVAMVSPADAAVLGCASGAPYLRSRRLSRNPRGIPVEYTTSLLHPEHYTLQAEF